MFYDDLISFNKTSRNYVCIYIYIILEIYVV